MGQKQEGRYLIEDDYDSEFRYKGRPIPALQGMDDSQKVIYMGTFSRSIAPAIRVGFMVLPEPLLALYREKQVLCINCIKSGPEYPDSFYYRRIL